MKAAPVLFNIDVLTSPPKSLARDFAVQAAGTTGWACRQDPAKTQANFHVIVSTGSGTGLAEVVWKQLVKPVLEFMRFTNGKDYALHFTTSGSSVQEFASAVLLPRANLGVSQTVLLMSGDGGVFDIVNVLLSGQRSDNYNKPSISLCPLGTGNALAHSAGITQNNTMGLRTWLRGGLKELPLFYANFSQGARFIVNGSQQEQPIYTVDGAPTVHGAVVVSWGLHAGLVADSDTVELRRYGGERFKMAAKEALFPSDGSAPHVYRAKVSIQRPGTAGLFEVRQGEHAYILLTLVSQMEQGFMISPASKPLDGRLRLIHFGPMSGTDAMAIMSQAYHEGKHIEDERVGYEEIEALRIEFREDDARWRRICIDGKIVQVEKDGWIEVQASQKNIIDLVI